MTCKQCKHFEECKDDAFFSGAEFDPNKSVEYCTGFELITNADRIRAMTDRELANFLSAKFADLQAKQLSQPTATQIHAIAHTWFCSWMQWLKQPAGEE